MLHPVDYVCGTSRRPRVFLSHSSAARLHLSFQLVPASASYTAQPLITRTHPHTSKHISR